MFIKKFPNSLNVIEPFNLPEELTFKIDDLDDGKDYPELIEKCSQLISRKFYFSNNITLYLSDCITAWNFILKTCPKLIRKIGSLNNTLLHSAAKSGHTDICKLLLEEYPWLINTKISVFKTTALYSAVVNGHVGTCRLLLSNSNPEDINRPYSNGNTILHEAVENHKYKICQILIPEMSLESINQPNSKGQTALGLLKKTPVMTAGGITLHLTIQRKGN